MKKEQKIRKVIGQDADNLSNEDLLELLLQFTASDSETLVLHLKEQYPTIDKLIEARAEDLRTVDGMDEDSLLLLRLVPELHRRYFIARSHVEDRLTDSQAYGRYLLPKFHHMRDEAVFLLLLDGVGKVINCRLIGQGSVNSANVPARRLVQEALVANASGMVIAHNHPSGLAIPSREDIEVTLRLRDALEILDIVLLDHIIVADDDFVSLRDSGYLRRI